MSFGFSVGDFLAVGQLSWKIYKKCKESPGNYKELSTEVGALHNVIKQTEELFSQQDLTSQQKDTLLECQQGCEDVLKDLDSLLVKYESLGTNSRRTFDRMGFGTQDMNNIRLRLILSVSNLDAFLNVSSHARLESKLNLLIAEVRAGKREGSVISTQTFDTTARNDRETWEALRRELEDIGISPGIITEKRQFIIAWFQEAVAAGKLEEDVVPTDSNSVISSHEFQSRADSGDDDYIPTREMSSMMIESSTTERRVAPRSEPGALRHLRQPADQLSSPPSPKKRSTRIRVTYLLQKLLGRDQQFLEAALSGDISTVTKLLDKGVDIETKASWDRLGMRTALQLMSDLGRDRIVQFLLSRGADVHAKDEYGNTAVHMAAGHDYKIVVDLLLKHGADIESKDSDGNTALLHATKSGYEDMVRLLVERGAEIESKDSNGTTALMIAAGQGREDMVWLLLEQGAEIESEDSNGYTALMFAVEEGRQETVQILLDGGAKIGDTVLKLAKRWSRQEIIRILQSSGASRSSSRKKSVPPSEWTRMTSQYLNSKP